MREQQNPRGIEMHSPSYRMSKRRSSKETQHISPNRKDDLLDKLFMKKVHFFTTALTLKRTLFIVALICIVISIGTLMISLHVETYQMIYANERKCIVEKKEAPKCTITISVLNQMQAPVYILYYIQNVYINHKKYLNSISLEQLKGKAISVQKAEQQCYPIIYNKDLPFKKSWGGQLLKPDEVASPCGLKAMFFFNDTFSIYGPSGKVSIKQDGIYTGKAINTKRQPQSQQKQWIDPENEHFKLHLLDGALMTKKKLWGKIEQNLSPGNYTIEIENNYMISDMMIHKGVQLSTAGPLGGFNLFFPIVFALAGIASLVVGSVVHFKLDKVDETLLLHSHGKQK